MARIPKWLRRAGAIAAEFLPALLTNPAPGTLAATPPLNPHAAPDPEALCAVCRFPLRLHSALGINSHTFTPERCDAPADSTHIPEGGI